MQPKDALYNYVFKDLMNKGLSQKQAGDAAARAVYLWTHGRSYQVAIKTVMGEMKDLIKVARKRARARAA